MQRGLILTHLLDAHVHLAVAYYQGTNEAGDSGLRALHTCEDAIREIASSHQYTEREAPDNA